MALRLSWLTSRLQIVSAISVLWLADDRQLALYGQQWSRDYLASL